jgi:glutaredoxin
MLDKILIFGKSGWPYTTSAREAYDKQNREIKYIDVKASTENLDQMLKYSDGTRKVPTIVDAGEVIIGFDGGSWGV